MSLSSDEGITPARTWCIRLRTAHNRHTSKPLPLYRGATGLWCRLGVVETGLGMSVCVHCTGRVHVTVQLRAAADPFRRLGYLRLE